MSGLPPYPPATTVTRRRAAGSSGHSCGGRTGVRREHGRDSPSARRVGLGVGLGTGETSRVGDGSGGTEAALTPMGLSGFQNMRALSTRNDEPAAASRRFDSDRDGFVMSEGAGILVMEELEHARNRGARIYCEVLGFGASCDAGHMTQPNERGEGAAKAMRNALVDAQIEPDRVDYINAHGTSTPLGDKAETHAVKRVFEDHAYQLSIYSTKSQLGHSLGASGGIELILTIKAIQNCTVPPTINLDTPDPECDLDFTPLVAKERNINVAMSNSFGFGGHNASIVIGALRNGAP